MSIRDGVVDFIQYWSRRVDLPVSCLLAWLALPRSKWYDWQRRYGQENQHNAPIPRDFWLAVWEKEAILAFQIQHPQEGYRRLTFIMLDQDIVAVSPSSVYRILKEAGQLQRWDRKPSKKGTGFDQPSAPHEHWHIDLSYLNICATFYYLCSILDGYSRYLVHWEIRESMKEFDVEIVLQRGLERFPGVSPRVISDNGSPFVAREFKDFIRLSGLTHVRTSPNHPQSNGKKERFFRTAKDEAIRPGTPLSVADARRIMDRYSTRYNEERLHSAIDYITPKDKLEGRAEAIWHERTLKLETARQRRKEPFHHSAVQESALAAS
jgi:transposase InsO family protein